MSFHSKSSEMRRRIWKLDGEQTEKDLDEKEYKSWVSEARAARSAYVRGEMSEDEFRNVIYKLDQKTVESYRLIY